MEAERDYDLIVKNNPDKFFPYHGIYSTKGKSIDKSKLRGKITDVYLETTLELTIELKPIVVNEDIVLDNIYYDYDDYKIREDAQPELDKLVQMMKDAPHIIIELQSHTDNRGDDQYNLDLSQKRAQSAVDYIISKGIESRRISAKGYGGNQTRS